MVYNDYTSVMDRQEVVIVIRYTGPYSGTFLQVSATFFQGLCMPAGGLTQAVRG
jgi:hypothetical protein